MAIDLEKIKSISKEACERIGCRLYDVVFVTGSRGQGRKLMVFVDKENGGPTLDECESVSRAVSLLLDVDDAVTGGEYILEVSSPGLDRHLSERWHYEKSVGQEITIETNEDMNELLNLGAKVKRFRASGKLLNVVDNYIEFELDSKKIQVPLNIIKKSKVNYSFGGNNGR